MEPLVATTLAPHPRLYASPSQLARLRQPARHRLLRRADAATFARATDFDYPRDVHNEHLLRARAAQTRVVTLLVRFLQTGDARYREAALRHVAAIGAWEYWSWITWRQGNPDPLAIFDLSCGENSATLAIAYDWLRDTLSDAERGLFRRIAAARSFAPFLKHTASEEKGQHAWWYRHAASNWNTVCAGGAGMLALALHEELPEAATVLERAERSFVPYMQSLRASGGAWPEGIGYWNYGMRYAFMYLLSHERATGRPHPLLRQAATRKTLWFPLDFCPHGVPCSFGDVNHWSPLPFHYAAAERLKEPGLVAALDRHLGQADYARNNWPTAAELLVFHPRVADPARPATRHVVKLYAGQDWGVLADRLPAPRLYLAVRGGTTKVPHGHRDLMSFHAVVADEALLPNLGVGEYLDTTFSERRWELFETMPGSKNTILINGVGIAGDSTVVTTPIEIAEGVAGLRIDATDAMGKMRDGPVTTFCGRVFLMLRGKAALIVDHVELPHVGRVEARFHTFARATLRKDRAELRGKRQRMTMAFACSEPAGLWSAAGAPTTPGPGATMIRWCTDKQVYRATLATLLLPGAARVGAVPRARVASTPGRAILIHVTGAGLPGRVALSERLEAVAR